MPNMFGGDQHHPSYDPRTKLQRSEAMDGNTLCRVLDRVTVRYEEVDGTTRTGHVNNALRMFKPWRINYSAQLNRHNQHNT